MITLDEAWKIYLDSKSLSPESERKEIYRYNRHLRNYWEKCCISNIKYSDLCEYVKHLTRKALAPKTILHCLGLLKAIMNRAILFELYSGVLPKFPTIKYDNKRQRFLSKKEVKPLLQALKKKSQLWYDIACFSLNTGMRASEIFRIKQEDVHLDQKEVILYNTKNHTTRSVPLNTISLEIVNTYLEKEMKFLFFEKPPRDVSSLFTAAVKETNLNKNVTDRRNKVVFHTLRHTFASWLVQKGVEITVVSKLMGHRTLEMTMRYAHLAPNQGHSAVKKLQKNFEKIN